MACEVCDEAFEGVGGRVFAEDVVEKGCILNGGEHGCCWGRNDIAWGSSLMAEYLVVRWSFDWIRRE